jgi:CDP-glycerol glycerophosphotransferase
MKYILKKWLPFKRLLSNYLLDRQVKLIRQSDFFDEGYYLKKYPDVAEAKVDPAKHYIQYGGIEHRQPSERFDAVYYLKQYHEVAKSRLNPLVHYIKYGKAKRFRVFPPNGMPSVFSEEQVLRIQIAQGDDSAEIHNELANCSRKQGKRWLEIGVRRDAISRDPNQAEWHFKLGEALEAMNRFQQAAESYRQAMKLEQDNPDFAFRAGFAYEREGFDGPGNPERALECYAEAAKHDKTGKAELLGIGIFHEKLGYWQEAVANYKKQLALDPENSELLYRAGLSYDRCYQWVEAENYISRSLLLDPTKYYRHARLGFVLERQGKFIEAATYYGYAANSQDRNSADWRYRQGVTLLKASCYKESAKAFFAMGKGLFSHNELMQQVASLEVQKDLAARQVSFISQSLLQDMRDPDIHFALGHAQSFLGEWQSAADAFSHALARKDGHSPDWYFSLGASLMKLGRYEEACKAFIETRLIPNAYGGISEEKLKKNRTYRRYALYAEYYENLPIQEKTVLYESFHGRSMACNPLAIFRYLLTRDDFADWKHIWVVNDRNKVPKEYRSLQNVVFLTRQSDAYLRALATTKVLINNSTFPYEFTRKKGQLYLNTWHGTPIKVLGKRMKECIEERPLAHDNTARNFLHATHLLSPNSHTSRVLIEDNDISALFSGEIAETGYPRIDATVSITESECVGLRSRLGVKENEKLLLYAPTFRGAFGKTKVDVSSLLDDLKSMRGEGVKVLFRGHYETEKLLSAHSLGDMVVSEDVDTNLLLAVTDILVTDYSSVAFDFLPRRKPIIYYAYDLEEYERERGMYFPLSDLPGEICQSRKELQEAILHAETRFDLNRQEKAIERFCPKDNGQVTQRVVDWVFLGDSEGLRVLTNERRKKILFYGGSIMPNGITTSLINLTSQLNYKKYAVTLLVDAAGVRNHEDRLQQFKRLPDSLHIIARVGELLLTHEESWINSKLESMHDLAAPEMWKILERGYTREMRRITGSVEVDTMVNFDGYTRLFHYLFALAPRSTVNNKMLYLHNDLQSEWRERFPFLEGSFRLYKYYDALVNVSSAVRDHNRNNLSHAFAIEREKFTFAPNVQNPEYIHASAQAKIDVKEDAILFDKAKPAFITMARLSVEKGQEKLIRAFAGVVAQAPLAKLFILGDGPLRDHLTSVIKDLRLKQNVFLLGQKYNPFSYLQRADYFVFPSDHEGQGMVLHEALILRKPILATDIPTSREILSHMPPEWLVENSIEGLESGMLAFIKTPPSPVQFDIDAYQKDALDAFYTNVLGETRQ